MEYQVELREIQPRFVARAGGSCPASAVGDTLTRVLLPRVYQFLAARRIAPAGPPIALYHEFSADRARLEGAVPVDATFDGDDEVQPGALPGGRVATTRHVGPYHELGAAHDAVVRWIRDRGYRAVRPNWEVYPMPPGGEPDPARLVTEIYWPIG
ncbi:MAG: GyrI-like domain-containing protein [Chloroflexota bacterium]